MSEKKREYYIRSLEEILESEWTKISHEAYFTEGAIKDLLELLKGEPKRLIDDDFETIRIHLNAYKEKLCNQRRWEEAEEYQRIIDRFMAFASAQPDLQPTCNNLATDTISRQVAIDAVNKIAPVNTEYDCTLLDILDVRYVLTELPSAESELIWCKDCKHWYSDADCGMACELTNMSQPEDGFCNWAERKEECTL